MSERVADVAIIGGGIIGMSSAYELARQGAGNVVVFDKFTPASGTTGGSAGVICLHNLGELYATFTLLGYERIKQLSREYAFPFYPWGYLDVVYEPGTFPPAPHPYDLRFGAGAESIHAHEYLSRDELVRRYPWIKPERVQGGVLYPNQGFINPHQLVELYQRLALATGQVEIHACTPVLQVRRSGERITSLVTRRGEWQVGTVLNAGGPWGAKVAALAGSTLALTPQRIQVCTATAFDDGVEEAPLIGLPESVNGEGVWCRGELGGMLLFGEHHHTTRPEYTVDPDFVNRATNTGQPEAVEAVYRRYWHLPRSQFLHGWCCVYGTTEDGFPIISRDPVLHNFYHAVGMNGHGMTIHAAVARSVTQLLLHDNTLLATGDIPGAPASIDFSGLDAARFAQGKLLTFALDHVGT